MVYIGMCINPVILQFQSHQIFHVLVVAAAFVHYHGISEMAMYRMSVGSCDAQNDPPLEFWTT